MSGCTQANATEIARQPRPNGFIGDEVRVVCREIDKTEQESEKVPNQPPQRGGSDASQYRR
uniref:Uncharacterized protein n=1 Tax=Paraburkholderia sprentiae WSM5005 TaxID=754502 RepID=A0A1I9YS86_9BURK